MSQHHLPVQDQYPRPRHPKSPTRVRQPYTFNCGRKRWPPSPKVEEVKCEEEIPMRGKIGQDPMIIDVSYSTSYDSGSTYSRDSNYSSEPETPSASESDNPDRRYIWKPKPDVPISQAHNAANNTTPTQREGTVSISDRDRGRKVMHKLNTDLVQNKSTGAFSPLLERARSPYASGPQDRKPKPDRFSGEYLLSPDMMSPQRAYANSPRSQSQYFRRPAESHTSGRPAQGKDGPRQPVRPSMENQRSHSHYVPRPVEVHNREREIEGRDSPRVSVRPPMERRCSELPYPNSPPATERATRDRSTHRRAERPSMDERPYPVTPPSAGKFRPRSRRPGGSQPNSDSDHGKTGGESGGASSQNPPLHQTTNFQDHNRRQFSSELPASHPRRAVPSLDNVGAPVNLSSLVSGAAIHQTLAAMLNGDHTPERKASPRPSPRPSPGVSPLASPRGSPKTSPYSSPPRTPLSESHYHRANPITGLKKDSPISRPSSPLSSRSSTWTMEPDQTPSDGDHNRRSRPAPLKSRRTAPLPGHKIEEPEESELSTPGVVVRSPSPARHVKPLFPQSVEPQHSRIEPPALPTAPCQPTTLRPTGFSGRPRSVSSADVRPKLSLNPSDSSSSPRSGSRARSPSVVSPGDRYKPPNLEPILPANSSFPHPDTASSTTRSRSRSRSYVPESSQADLTPLATTLDAPAPASRSRSIIPTPGSVDRRSQSSAPKPLIPASPTMQPSILPPCPRPHSVTGYGDWYTLNQNTAFTICPTCRDNVFGSNHQHYLQPRSVSLSWKTLCDLNNPWIRLACLLRGPDVKLLSALSEVTTKERACPGDELAPRDWYRLEDPDNGKHISGVNVCPHCVHSLEVLFPSWRDVFYRAHSSHHHDIKERFCSLRSSGIRFGDYLDMIVESSREAESRRKPPNTKPVCDLAKQLAATDDCPRDKMNARKAWHVHPHLPEFTICQDCYETVVYPLVKTGSPLAAKIDKKPQQFPNPDVKCCCNLYSPRMRKVFREACEDDDYEHLRHTVLRRHMLQQDLLETLGEQEQHPRDDEITDRLQELVAKWKDKE